MSGSSTGPKAAADSVYFEHVDGVYHHLQKHSENESGVVLDILWPDSYPEKKAPTETVF